VVHACNPSTWEAEAGGSQVLGHPGLGFKRGKTKKTRTKSKKKQQDLWVKVSESK
jgi:hypothetical protein